MILRGILPYALSALIAFGTGWTVNGWRLGTIVAQARTEAAQINAIVARNEADIERARANRNAAEALKASAQARRVTDLTASLAEAQRARDAANATLRELLNAPTTDARDLGPTVLRYLDGVRREQAVN